MKKIMKALSAMCAAAIAGALSAAYATEFDSYHTLAMYDFTESAACGWTTTMDVSEGGLSSTNAKYAYINLDSMSLIEGQEYKVDVSYSLTTAGYWTNILCGAINASDGGNYSSENNYVAYGKASHKAVGDYSMSFDFTYSQEIYSDGICLNFYRSNNNTVILSNVTITYNAVPEDAVVKIGDTYYTTLDEAVTAANESDESNAVLNLLKDCNLSTKLTKKVTINGNNKTINVTVNSIGTELSSEGFTAINDVMFVGGTYKCMAQTPFDMKNVTITGAVMNYIADRHTYTPILDNVRITNCTFNEAVMQVYSGKETILKNCEFTDNTYLNKKGINAGNNTSYTLSENTKIDYVTGSGTGKITLKDASMVGTIYADSIFSIIIDPSWTGSAKIDISGSEAGSVIASGVTEDNKARLSIINIPDGLAVDLSDGNLILTTNNESALSVAMAKTFHEEDETGFIAVITNNSANNGSFDTVKWNISDGNETRIKEAKYGTISLASNASIYIGAIVNKANLVCTAIVVE